MTISNLLYSYALFGVMSSPRTTFIFRHQLYIGKSGENKYIEVMHLLLG